MAKFVLTAEFVTIASTDVTASCSQAELQITVADEDVTNYASLGWHERLGGLKDAKLVLNFYNDFAATALDSVFWPLLGTVQTFEVRGTQSARGTSNPAYTGSVLITDWNPITGKVGDVDTVSVTWPSTGAITRATS
jgi:hypothetical protein